MPEELKGHERDEVFYQYLGRARREGTTAYLMRLCRSTWKTWLLVGDKDHAYGMKHLPKENEYRYAIQEV